MRSTNGPAPICFSHTWKGPPRSATNETNLPSGEIAASTSLPSKLVKGVILAPASGSVDDDRRALRVSVIVTTPSITTAAIAAIVVHDRALVDAAARARLVSERTSRPNARSRADWKRSSRDFSRQRATMRAKAGGTSADRSGCGGSLRIAAIVSAAVLRTKAGRSSQHLVEHSAEAEDVGAVIDGLAANLLGRHVADRSQNLAGVGLGCAVRGGRTFVNRARQLGDAKVENFEAPVTGDEEIVRLDVSMNDVSLVSDGQAVGNLARVLDRGPRRQRAALEAASQ